MESIITPITWEQIKPLIPPTYLYYVDYRDSLDNRLEEVEKCIHTGEYEALDNIFEDWIPDVETEVEELKTSIENAFPHLTEEEVEEIMEEFEDKILDQIYENDKSTPLEDLFRNTGRQTMFYDTGYEMESDSWQWDDKRVSQERRAIFKYLGIKTKEEGIINGVEMMIRQASYGGTLVVYFYDNPADFISFDKDINSITFSAFTIAVIDTCNGSGDNYDFPSSFEITLPFERERLHICSNIKYSYTHSVCGMTSNWCEATNVSLNEKKSRKTLLNSGLSAVQNKDKKYAETYRLGKCTIGDMDITRHRNVVYINEYPCGNRCKDCGSFWID